MDTEKDTQANEGDAAEDTEGQTWNPVHQAVPEEDTAGEGAPVTDAEPDGDGKDAEGEDTEGQTWNPVHQ